MNEWKNEKLYWSVSFFGYKLVVDTLKEIVEYKIQLFIKVTKKKDACILYDYLKDFLEILYIEKTV